MFRLKGVIPPMITPFTGDGKLDEKNLQKLVEYLSGKVEGLFICGSYGCGPLMSLEERRRTAEIVKKYAGPETVIVVHTGTTNARDTIELSLHAREIGCDAAAAVGPYYYKYKDLDLLRYYEAILKETKDFPFYAYHNPQFQGYETSLEVFRQLKDMGMSGIKDATFNIMQYAAYQRELADEAFDIALGTEAMYRQSMAGEADQALQSQFRVNKLRDIMYLTRSTQLAIYAIAEIRGIMTAYPRAPFIPATKEEKQNIAQGLKELGLL